MRNQVIAATWLARRDEAVLAMRPHGLDAYFLQIAVLTTGGRSFAGGVNAG